MIINTDFTSFLCLFQIVMSQHVLSSLLVNNTIKNLVVDFRPFQLVGIN